MTKSKTKSLTVTKLKDLIGDKTLKLKLWQNSLRHFLKIYFLLQGKWAILERGKCHIFRANVSKIKGQMCHFQGKCALFDQGKCAKGKWIIARIWTKNSNTPMGILLKNLRPFQNYNIKIQWEIIFFDFFQYWPKLLKKN